MKITSVLVLLVLLHLLFVAATALKPRSGVEEEKRLKTPELIIRDGYPVEVHEVRTADGYLLEVHRIPGVANSSAGSRDKPAVFLQHGILCSSVDWVVTGPGKGFAYILADQGYDVWMGNSRGNMYSRKHAVHNPRDGIFWNFSWHEMGMHDLPAVIDHVLAVTGQKDLFYIGHSQGTAQFFVMASERPEYNAKIRVMFAMAPIAYMEHATSLLVTTLSTLYTSNKDLQAALENKLPYEIFPYTMLAQKINQLVCNDNTFTQKFVCLNVIFSIMGFSGKRVNPALFSTILRHYPAGTSSKTVTHYIQLALSGKFQQYDYSAGGGNLRHYGSSSPPKYDLQKITCPVSIHYTTNDLLAHQTDVDRLFQQLSNPIGKFLVPEKTFNHVDYLWAVDAKKLVYDKITTIMKQFV